MHPYHAICEIQNIRGDGSASSTDHLPLSKTTTVEKVFRWGYAKQLGSRGFGVMDPDVHERAVYLVLESKNFF